jgi:Endoplasmic Reticulum Oxidoreductin 1 (ERO1)
LFLFLPLVFGPLPHLTFDNFHGFHTKVPESIRKADMDEHYFELDGWARWDMPSSDYFDTKIFSEGYTGYDGSEVWEFIHDRICFKGYDYDDDHWKADFNKAVSGLHSMISAQVVIGIKEKVDNAIEFGDAEVWRDPKQEFQRRLSPKGETPQALENLYFCFMLLLAATAKSSQRLLADCASGKIDAATAQDLKLALSCSLLGEDSIEVASRKLRDHAVKDSDSVEALWDARMRSRDLLRIMNCVQCNKCRLHGKIAILGLATAMQVLVGHAGEGSDPGTLHRVELAALMATLQRCSEAIKFCQDMQQS